MPNVREVGLRSEIRVIVGLKFGLPAKPSSAALQENVRRLFTRHWIISSHKRNSYEASTNFALT